MTISSSKIAICRNEDAPWCQKGIRKILSCKDLKTTVIDAHVASLGAGVESPLDSLDISDPASMR